MKQTTQPFKLSRHQIWFCDLLMQEVWRGKLNSIWNNLFLGLLHISWPLISSKVILFPWSGKHLHREHWRLFTTSGELLTRALNVPARVLHRCKHRGGRWVWKYLHSPTHWALAYINILIYTFSCFLFALKESSAFLTQLRKKFTVIS